MSPPNLTKAATWYARHGWYVVPLHHPTPGGCSCESWRRANGAPDYVCRTPGKHPRRNDWEERASNNPAEVAEWWGRSPHSNIGIAAGRSGLLVVDADIYKVGGLVYEGETITSLTGGGGEHLIYAMPEGADYGNAKGNLPAWLDIRGYGGQFVAPPSLHPSGRRYEWEPGYGPHEMTPQPLPESIASILLEAKTSAAIQFGAPVFVDLSEYAERLPALALALLHNDRSKVDFWLIRTLVRAGLTPEEIKAAWDAYDPTGKYSEKAGHGPGYLALTIAAAREHLAHPVIDGRAIDPNSRSGL